jgi:hypothetical protein
MDSKRGKYACKYEKQTGMNFILSVPVACVCHAVVHFIYFASGRGRAQTGFWPGALSKIISLAGDRKFINKLTILLR